MDRLPPDRRPDWEAHPGQVTRCRRCGAVCVLETSRRGTPYLPNAGSHEPHFLSCPAGPGRPPAKTAHVPPGVCFKCGGRELERFPATPPHGERVRCLACGASRWLPKPAKPAKPATTTIPGELGGE